MRIISTGLVGVVLVSMTAQSAAAASFSITPDGLGDFPTLQAGIDAALAGDTLSLGDGTFVGAGNRDLDLGGKDLVIVGASGDAASVVIDAQGSSGDPHRVFTFHSGETSATLIANVTLTGGYTTSSGGAILADTTSTPTLRRLVFHGNTAEVSGGALSAAMGSDLTLEACTFVENDAPVGAAIMATDATLTGTRVLIAGNLTGEPVGCAGTGDVSLSCSDVFGNAAGDWVGCLAGDDAIDDNFSADPRFCDAGAGDYTLAANSPCVDGSHPGGASCGGDVGALGVGCAAISLAYSITPDGLGDFPTLQAGIDAALAGDTLSLGDGTFVGAGNRDLDLGGKDLVIVGASGDPASVVIDAQGSSGDPHRVFTFHSGETSATIIESLTLTGGYTTASGGAILADTTSTPTLRRLLFHGNTAEVSGGALACAQSSDVVIESCTFVDNDAPLGAAIMATDAVPSGTRVLIAGNLTGEPVGCAGTGDVSLSCSDVFGNAAGDWVGCLAGDDAIDDNFSADPRFCDAGAADYTLAANSPCVDGSHPGGASCGGDVGALGVGCAAISLAYSITPDGLGDFPTLQAGIDAALAGDTLSLGDGTFVGAGNRDLDLGGKDLVIVGASGDAAAVILDAQGSSGDPHRAFVFHSGETSATVIESLTLTGGYTTSSGGAVLADTTSTPTLRRLVFHGNTAEVSGGALSAAMGSDLTLEACTFVENDAPVGAAIMATDAVPSGTRVLIAGNLTGEPVACAGTGDVSLSCSDVFGNAAGDWVGCLAGDDAIDDNFSADPRFCDAGAGDYTLAANSPCVDGSHPGGASCGGDVGALGVGCAADQQVFVITPDGLGDFPTLQAGIDAALAGDTLSLGDGTFVGAGNRDLDLGGKDLVIVGASGDAAAVILDAQGSSGDPHRAFVFHSGETSATVIESLTLTGGYTTASGGAILADTTSTPTLRRLVFHGNTAEVSGGALSAAMGSDLTLEACTFVDNDAPVGAAIMATDATLTGTRVLIAGNLTGEPVGCAGTGDVSLSCSDVFGNAAGDWVGCLAGDDAIDDNFSADPRFCDAGAGDYTLAANSPCVDGSHPGGASCGGDVGAHSVGCAADQQVFVITPDGLGDFPTLQAGIDAALAGDTLSLGDGTFVGAGNRDLDLGGKDLVIVGASGDAASVVIDAQGSSGDPHRVFTFHSGETSATLIANVTLTGGYTTSSGGAILADTTSTPTLRRLVFHGNTAEVSGGALACAQSSDVVIESCTFVDNDAPAGAAIMATDATLTGTRVLIAGNLTSEPVACAGTGDVSLSCSDVFGNAAGDWVGCLAGDDAIDDNFSADPRFCDAGAADYTLAANSPCVDGSHPGGASCGGDVGALGVGCAADQQVFVITPDGLGDFPTLQAGIDAALAGDTLSLGDGTFVGAGNRDLDLGGKDLVIVGASGDPASVVIDAQGSSGDPHRVFTFHSGETSATLIANVTLTGGYTTSSGGAILADTTSTPTLRRLVFHGNTAEVSGGALSAAMGSDLTLEACTFVENDAPVGAAIMATDATLTGTRVLIAGNLTGEPVGCAGTGDVSLSCSDVFGNAAGDWVGCLAGDDAIDDNFSADPRFCDAGAGDYTLAANSPCVDGSHPGGASCGGDVGALGVGCAAISLAYSITPDGLGDFPTLQAGIDAALAGDTLSLGDGTFVGAGNRDLDLGGKDLVIVGASGDPASVVIDAQGSSGDPHRVFTFHSGETSATIIESLTLTGGYTTSSGGAVLADTTSTPTLRRLVFHGNTAEVSGGALSAAMGSDLTLEACTFVENDAPVGAAIMATDAVPSGTRVLIAGNLTGEPVACAGTGDVSLSCSDVFGNAAGDWVGCLAGDDAIDDNFSADPRFCDAGAADYTLAANSPCVDGSHPGGASCGGDVGALGVGCAAISLAYSITPDGLGDFPTLQAGIDAALAGDTLSLGDGTFVGAGNRDLDLGGKDLVIVGASGDAAAVILDAQGSSGDPHRAFVFHSGETSATVIESLTLTGGYTTSSGGAVLADTTSTPTLRRLVFHGNTAEVSGGALSAAMGSDLTLEACTFVENDAPVGAAIMATDAVPSGTRVLIAGNLTGEPVACAGTGDVSLSCSDVFGNAAGDWVGCLAGDDAIDDNFSADPRFCDAGAGDYTLAANSPCVDGSHPGGASCGGDVGALGVGCAADQQVFVITPDGLGDFPTLQAGIDAALAGDTLSLGDGTFVGAGNRDLDLGGKDLVIVGASGDAAAVILDAQGSSGDPHRAFVFHSGETSATVIESLTLTGGYTTASGGAILADTTSTPTLRRLVFHGNTAEVSGGALSAAMGSDLTLEACTFVDNDAPVGAAIMATDATLTGTRVLIAGNLTGEPVGCAGTGDVSLSCSDVFGNAAGDWVGCLAGDDAIDDNFSADPRFCDAGAGDYTLAANSPCVDGSHPGGASCGGDVGAHSVGCAADQQVFVITPDGLGDFPTLQAGIDAALAGDTLSLGDGTFVGAGNRDLDLGGKDLVIVGASGDPASVVIDAQGSSGDPHRVFTFHSGETSATIIESLTLTGGYTTASGGAILADTTSTPTLRRLLFHGNTAEVSGGALSAAMGSDLTLEACTFVENDAPVGAAIMATDAVPSGTRVLIAGNLTGEPVGCAGTGDVSLSCSDVFGNAAGDWVGCLAGDDAIDDNFSADPRFCDAGAADYTLAANSPCVDGSHPGGASCGGDVGALGVGCAADQQVFVITPDGLGDFPTLQAGIDAALAGDTLSLGDGTFVGAGNRDLDLGGKDLVIVGASGDPASVVIDAQGSSGDPHRVFTFHSGETSATVIESLTLTGGYTTASGGAILADTTSTPTLRRLVFHGNTAEVSGGALSAAMGSDLTLEACTFVDNDAPAGAAIMATDATLTGTRVLIAGNLTSEPVACAGTGDVTLSCSDVFGNAAGDWVGCLAGDDAIDDNFSADPRFCDAGAGDYTLAANSPCVDGSHPGGASCGGDVGALGVGCAAISLAYSITPDGLGDFPTLQAGIDAALAGDTLSLGDGTFVGAGNRDLDLGGKDLVIVGASGDPASVVIDAQGSSGDPHRVFTFHSGETSATVIESLTLTGGYTTASGGAILADTTSTPTLRRLVFHGNTAEVSGGALSAAMGSDLTLEACTFVENDAPVGAAIMATDAVPSGTRVLIAGNLTGEPVGCAGTGDVSLSCSDVFGNAAGDWVGCLAGDDAIDDNFSADPRFCDAGAGDYTLAANSPCVDGSHPGGASCGGDVGALGVGCAAISLAYSITPDGLGDFPTLQAGIDAALAGDTLSLGDGTFVGAGNRDLDLGGKDLVIVGASGDAAAVILDAQGSSGDPHRAFVFHSGETSATVIESLTLTGGYTTSSGGAVLADTTSTPTLRRLVFHGNTAEVSGGALAALMGSDVALEACTFVDNDAPVGAAIMATDAVPSGTRVLIAGNLTGEPVGCAGTGDVSLSCSDVFGNAAGDWVGCLAGDDAIDDNFSADPRFCDAGAGDYTLAANSPCVDGSHPGGASCGGDVGALGVGCAADQQVFVITPDGLGDFPTLQAGIDAALAGDTLSLGDGTFVGAGNRDLDLGGKDLVIVGASGDPASVVIDAQGSSGDPHRAFTFHSGETSATVIESLTLTGGYTTASGGAILADTTSTPTLRRLVFHGNTAEVSGGALSAAMGSDLTLEACTFVDNDAPVGAAIMATDAVPSGTRVLIAGNLTGEPVGCAGTGDVSLSCSDVFGNAAGDWVGCLAGDDAIDDNFSADPRFCDAGAGDYTLAANSPCVDGSHPGGASCGGDVGALGVGCAADQQVFVITPDGLGDFPTLQAGIDAALAGDTLSLGDGTFVGAGNRDLDLGGKDLVIVGASGDPASVVIDAQGSSGDPHRVFTFHSGETSATVIESLTLTGGYTTASGGAILADTTSTPTLRRLVFHGNTAEVSGGALSAAMGSDLTLEACTFVENDAPVGAAIMATDAVPSGTRVLIAGNLTGEPVGCAGTGDVSLSCSDVFGNAAGDWVGCLAGDDAIDDNFSADPRFCDAGAGDYTLAANSPCVDGSHPGGASCGGDVGALGVGCAADQQVFVITPDGLGDFPTLQAGIDAALAGDTLSLGDGTFVGAGNRDLDLGGKDLVIVGASGDAASVVIDAQGSSGDPHRVFTFHSGETSATLIANVTLTGGYTTSSGGAILADTTSTPTLRRLVFHGNTAEVSGGALACAQSSDVVIESCTFYGNAAPSGGAIHGQDSSPTLSSTLIAENTAGGAVACSGTSEPTLACSNVFGNLGGDWVDCIALQDTLSSNFSADPLFCDAPANDLSLAENSPCLPGNHPAGESCGVIGALGQGCDVIVPRTWFVTDDGLGDAPTIQAAIDSARAGDDVLVEAGSYTWTSQSSSGPSMLTMKSGVLLHSTSGSALTTVDAEGQGRCLDLSGVDSTGVVVGFAFTGGAAVDGAGMRVDGGNPIVRSSRFYENAATRDGGGAYLSSGASPTLEDNRFDGNTADRYGGAIASFSSSLSLLRDAVDTNVATARGGGLYLVFSTLDADSVTISGNDAGVGLGGGTYIFGEGATEAASQAFTACTFSGNSAFYGGGVYARGASQGGSGTTFDACVFDTNAADAQGGGVLCFNQSHLAFQGCTFYANRAGTGAHVRAVGDSDPVLSQSILSFATIGDAISCSDVVDEPQISCCDVYGNAGGDALCGADLGGNFSLDPEFINAAAGDFHLLGSSPCLPGNHPSGASCGLIGAFGLADALPLLLSLEDVDNDQGRQIRLKWQRSFYDAPDDGVDVLGYELYRRQDLFRKGARLEGWDYVSTVPAHGEAIYQTVAPTLCDSTIADGQCFSVFFVRATTDDPLTFFDSPPDSGYSVDNLAPDPPAGLAFTTPVLLEWEAASEADFDTYTIYGSESEELDPEATLLGQTSEPLFDITGTSFAFYHVTTSDFSGNESDASSIGGVVGVDELPLPTVFALRRAGPNPARGWTLIAYDLPEPAPVRLSLYDVGGREVARLVDARQAAGRYEIQWDRRDARGAHLPAGVYFLTWRAGTHDATRRLVFLD